MRMLAGVLLLMTSPSPLEDGASPKLRKFDFISWTGQRLLVQHATAGRVSYRLTPWVPNNQNAEVSHNTITMANSTPPAMGSAQAG
jgi:hypothetical protein